MNAPNHLRRAVSSLTRETKGIVMAITAKDKLQFLFRVLGGCSSQVQCGRSLSRIGWFTKQLTCWPIPRRPQTADSITLHHPTTDYGNETCPTMAHCNRSTRRFIRPLITSPLPTSCSAPSQPTKSCGRMPNQLDLHYSVWPSLLSPLALFSSHFSLILPNAPPNVSETLYGF